MIFIFSILGRWIVLLVQFVFWFKIQNVFGLSPKITFFRFTNNLATSGCDNS